MKWLPRLSWATLANGCVAAGIGVSLFPGQTLRSAVFVVVLASVLFLRDRELERRIGGP